MCLIEHVFIFVLALLLFILLLFYSPLIAVKNVNEICGNRLTIYPANHSAVI